MYRFRLVLLIFITYIVILSKSYTRHYYPNPHFHKEFNVDMTVRPITPQYEFITESTSTTTIGTTTPSNDILVVDEHTGIKYNPYSKHHPGRHVCVIEKNVTYPVKTKQLICRPIYKKYMVRCGNHWCTGRRLAFEKYHKDVVTNKNASHYSYTCCPGWSQVTSRSYGCNKPHCRHPCRNGGTCARPNYCSCPPGYNGTYCEVQHTQVYTPSTMKTPAITAPSCSCRNNGICTPEGVCLCAPGYTGLHCGNDIDECKVLKPCDQICYNTPGSFKCDCKENFMLMNDGQTCRKEIDDALEANDLGFLNLDKRIDNLERLIHDRNQNEVTKHDLNVLYRNIGDISNRIQDISAKISDMELTSSGTKILARRKRSVPCAPCPTFKKPICPPLRRSYCPPPRKPCCPPVTRSCCPPVTKSCCPPMPKPCCPAIKKPKSILCQSTCCSSGEDKRARIGLLKTTRRKSNISIDQSEEEDEFIGGRKQVTTRNLTNKNEYVVEEPNLCVYEDDDDYVEYELECDCDTDATYVVPNRLSGGSSSNTPRRKYIRRIPCKRSENADLSSDREVIYQNNDYIDNNSSRKSSKRRLCEEKKSLEGTSRSRRSLSVEPNEKRDKSVDRKSYHVVFDCGSTDNKAEKRIIRKRRRRSSGGEGEPVTQMARDKSRARNARCLECGKNVRS